MVKTILRKRAIRRKRAIPRARLEELSAIKLGVFGLCWLVISANVLYLVGFFERQPAEHSTHTENNLIAEQNAMADPAAMLAANKPAEYSTPEIMERLEQEGQFVTDVKLVEPYRIVIENAGDEQPEESGLQAVQFNAMINAFADMEPVPIMSPVFFIGFALAAATLLKNRYMN